MKSLSVLFLGLGFICNAYSATADVLLPNDGQQLIAPADSNSHVTITGAVYTKDTRFPLLGNAWSKLDSNGHGLIWGDALRDSDGNLIHYAMTLSDSIQYCKDQGANLPTVEEWQALLGDLGTGTLGYNPYVSGSSNVEVIPGVNFTQSIYWTPSLDNYKCSGGVRSPEFFIVVGVGPDLNSGPYCGDTLQKFSVRCVISQ